MNEFELIARLIPGLPANERVVTGAGDDCAVLDLGLPERWALLKTDAVVEGVHFEREAPAEAIGHKALGRCLSDVAAMAGEPIAAVITLGLPSGFDADWVAAVYRGIERLARRFDVAIVGGETTRLPERALISVSLLGAVAKSRCRLRSGARPGDALFVTGELGGSILGRHLEFEPRLAEAAWMSAAFDVHSMIDVSDGLAGDLGHMLTASGVGAELLAQAIPISRAARQAAQAGAAAKPPLAAALSDGEDFELLFTLASADAVRLLDAWKNRFPALKLTCIGKITTEPGLRLRDRDGLRALPTRGYDHFRTA